MNSPHPHGAAHRCQAHLARSILSEGSHRLLDVNLAPHAGAVDIVLVVGGGRGSGALAEVDDVDRLEILVAPPVHHVRAHLQGKVWRPRRGHSRANLPRPRLPCTDPSPEEGAPPLTRTQSRESATAASGHPPCTDLEPEGGASHRHPRTQGRWDGEGRSSHHREGMR